MRSVTDSQMEQKKLQKFKVILKLYTYIAAHMEKEKQLEVKEKEKKSEVKQRCCSVPMSCYVRHFVTPWTTACQVFLSFTIFQSLLKLRAIKSVMPSNHLIPSSPSPPSLNLSRHQGLFQWVSFSSQVARVLELQFQHQSFQWIFRLDWLVWSCSPRDTQESSTSQFEGSNSSVLRLLYSPTLTPYMTTGKIIALTRRTLSAK